MESDIIKVGNKFWLTRFGLWIGLIGLLCLFFFLVVLYTVKGLPSEMSFVYYFKVMNNYVYTGLEFSVLLTLIGFLLSNLRKWTKTNLIIEGDRIQFNVEDKTIDLPRQKILKLVRLKSYFISSNKVRIITNRLEKHLIKVEDKTYNKLLEVYSDRFYEK